MSTTIHVMTISTHASIDQISMAFDIDQFLPMLRDTWADTLSEDGDMAEFDAIEAIDDIIEFMYDKQNITVEINQPMWAYDYTAINPIGVKS